MVPYSNYILIALLILGFLVRAYKITSQPMYGDELTIVYDAYSILKTGRDQTGEFLPLTFKMGAGRPAGYVYGSIPFVAIFGPTEWGVRGLSVLSGLGIIVLMFLLGKKLFNTKVGLIASFLTSISMWDIYLSRAGFEVHFALFLALLGIVSYLDKKYILMAFSWGIAIFTYPTFKLTLPLLFIFLIVFADIKDVFKSRKFLISILILTVFAGFSVRETLKGTSEERFLALNIFSDTKVQQEIIQNINEKRNLSELPESVKPFIYNKPLRYTRILFENYVENLSPQFLYLRGDRNPRHNPAEMGMLYLIEIPLLFLGLYYLAKNERRKLYLIIAWILIVPLATMLMGQTHALRDNLMLPAFLLISALALSNLSDLVGFFAFLLVGIQFASMLLTIYCFAPNKFGSFWSLEAKNKSIEAMSVNKDQQVILDASIDNIEYAYPVYAKIDPQEVIDQYGKYPKVYGNIVIKD